MKRNIASLFCLLLVSAFPVKALCGTSAENGVTVSMPDTVKAETRVVLSITPSRELPAGSFHRVDVTWLMQPEGRSPEVLAGVPESDIRFFTPGKYRCAVEIGIVSKGSCAGAAYDKISSHSLDIEVRNSAGR